MYVNEHKAMIKSIRDGKPINNGDVHVQQHAHCDHGPVVHVHGPGFDVGASS